jgi:hypothetical protein
MRAWRTTGPCSRAASSRSFRLTTWTEPGERAEATRPEAVSSSQRVALMSAYACRTKRSPVVPAC